MKRGATTKIRSGPLRTCAGCRRRRPQSELIRIARTATGDVVIDEPGSRTSGRGAYVCPEKVCVERALGGGLRRTLKQEGSLPGDLMERLLERVPAPAGPTARGRDVET
jgi:uncharacterized protein